MSVGRRAGRPEPPVQTEDAPPGYLDQARIGERVVGYPVGPTGSAALDAIAALSPTSDRGVYFTSGSAAALFTFTGFGRSIVAANNEAAFKATVNLEIGTDVQAYSANLDGWANEAVADYYTANDVDAGFQPLDGDLTSIAALATTSYGRGFLVLADAAAARGKLNLADVAASGDYADMTGIPILPTYTVAGVPAASSFPRGMIYVSDETGGAVPAFSDGTNWRRVTDRAVIS